MQVGGIIADVFESFPATMKVNIKVGSLVILSGPSGSGKSTVCEQIAKDYHPSLILSSDALREQFYESRPTGEGESLQPVDDRLIFQIMEEITHSRLREGLTTFIDATMLNDQTRGEIDCREKTSGYCFTEEELDELGNQLEIPRPKHFKSTLADADRLNKLEDQQQQLERMTLLENN